MFRRILGLLDHQVALLCALAGFLALSTLIPVGSAYFMKIAVDGIVSQTASTFRQGILVGVVVGLVATLSAGLPQYVRINVVQKLSKQMRDKLVASVLAMPLVESEKRPRGDLISRLTTDTDTGAGIFSYLYFFAETVLQAASALVYMLLLNWRVGLLCAATGPLVIVVSSLVAKPLSKASGNFQSALGEVANHGLNFLEGAPVVKAFTAEQFVEEAFGQKAGEARAAGVQVGLLTALNRGWAGLGSFLPFVVAVTYGGYMTLAGQLTLGGILALVKLCNNLAWPLNNLGYYSSEIARAQGALARVLAVLDEPAEADPVRPVEVSRRDGEQGEMPQGRPAIEVNGLYFGYGDGRSVLRDVSFRIERGAFVAIVGKSGSGKSTLLKILAGLYRPSRGTVFVLGHDVHFGAISFVRKKVAYLPQEPFLFPGTIEENLGLGNEGASRDDLLGALELALAADIVRGDPQGLALVVGEGGRVLSGGERQRLAIARTILREAEILLLDEPTSSVDKDSESRIWEALKTLMQGKTTVLVTHRLDVASTADLILVMDAGAVVEAGTFEELIKAPSLYRALYTGESAV